MAVYVDFSEGRQAELSGFVTCDSAAIRIWIRIARCKQPKQRQEHKPCETKAVFHFLQLLPVGSQESVLNVP